MASGRRRNMEVVLQSLLKEKLLVDEFPDAVEEHVSQGRLPAAHFGADLWPGQQQVGWNAVLRRYVRSVNAQPGPNDRTVARAVRFHRRFAGKLWPGQLAEERPRGSTLQQQIDIQFGGV